MQLVRKLGQRGDSIVEVLISIAVVGSVLGTSYAIVARNSRSYQQVNEHTDALKLAEDQIEVIRSIVRVGGDDSAKIAAVTGSNTFCIQAGKYIAAASDTCLFEDRYRIRISKPDAAQAQLFNVHVEWDGFDSNAEQLDLRYRI